MRHGRTGGYQEYGFLQAWGHPSDQTLLSEQLEHPAPPTQFTFVNQHEDVRSVLDRRIHNESHRHEIRSHVMRGVRQHELTLGKKRPTGRPPARTTSSDPGSSASTRSSTRNVVVVDPSREVTNSPLLPNHALTLYACPSGSYQFLDPFDMMPETKIPHAHIDSLMRYSISTFFPMSFPVEKTKTEKESRLTMLLQVKVHSPIAFIGFMATLAAHRAILHKNHDDLSPSNILHAHLIKDPDYKCALQEAVQSISEKVNSGATLDAEILEGCFSVVSAACIVGDFKQAADLLRYVSSDLQPVEVTRRAEGWLFLTDVKTAVGMLRKPIKALPWAKSRVPTDVLDRICSPASSCIFRLGTAFPNVIHITSQLRQLLADAIVVCHFCEFNALAYEGLDTHEHIIYRCKTLELEHDILSYVYDTFGYSDETPSISFIPPLEQILRLAVLAIMSTIAAVVHPGTGLGRALTYHQKNALNTYGARLHPSMDRAELKVIVWALFVFAQGAREQVDGPEFEYLLAQTCSWLDVHDWESAEELLLECLYVPSVQRSMWRQIWLSAQEIAIGWGKLRRVETSPPQTNLHAGGYIE